MSINDYILSIKQLIEGVEPDVLKLIFLLFTVFIVIFVNPILKLISKKIINKTSQSKSRIFTTIEQPLRLLILKTLFFSVIRGGAVYFSFSLPEWFSKAQWFIGFIIVIYGLWKTIDLIEDLILKNGKDATLAQVTGNIAKIILSFIFLLGILQLSGASLSGLLAFGGMGGLVVGMASKDLLSNIFGSIMIFLDKPFKVGDWIRSPDRKIEGTVEKIGLRVTCIRNFDKRPLYIPNSIFSNIIVENATRMSFRRINERIGIRHQDLSRIESIVSQIQNCIDDNPDIINNENPSVHFDNFNLNSLDIVINAHCSKTNKIEYQKVKQNLLIEIMGIISDNGAQCAKPVNSVFIDDDK